MISAFKERVLHRFFEVSVILKGVNGTLEIMAGIALLFVGAIGKIVFSLVQNELVEDPTDFLATHLSGFFHYFPIGPQFFGGFYLLSHGVIKIFLVISLLKKKLWAYPLSMIFLAIFIIYQIYRYFFTHSVFLILLTLLDIALIALIWHEYGHMKKRFGK